MPPDIQVPVFAVPGCHCDGRGLSAKRRAQDDLDACRTEVRKVEAALEQAHFEKSVVQRGADAAFGLSMLLLASV